MAIIHCGNIKCKYCSYNYKCTNKKVVLKAYKGFQQLLKCTSYEGSNLDRQAKGLIIIDEFHSESEKEK